MRRDGRDPFVALIGGAMPPNQEIATPLNVGGQGDPTKVASSRGSFEVWTVDDLRADPGRVKGMAVK